MIFSLVFVLSVGCALGSYESAGCSDEGCGIPCYLRPAEDECHYAEQSQCDGGGASDLETQLRLLNDSLVRLTEKLIQKGIIPAGSTCRPLPLIDNGGVIYSDLLITPGVVGKYVCEEGYSLHGHGAYECINGEWPGRDNEEPPTCEKSLVECEPLVAIPYGHVSYQTVDTTQILPGDVVTYTCDLPYKLEGVEYRICMRNGTWNADEPKCAEPATDSGEQTADRGKSNKSAIAAGVTVGVLLGVVLSVVVVIVVVKLLKKRHHKNQDYQELTNSPEDTDGKRNEQSALAEDVKQKHTATASEAKLGPDVETIH